MLQRYAPAYLVVDEHLDVVEFSSGLAFFLDPAGGAASLNVLGLVHEQLRMDLRTALQKAKTTRSPAMQAAVRIVRNGEQRSVDLIVEPRATDDQAVGYYVVIFKAAAVAADDRERLPDGAQEGSVEELEQALRATRERLESAIEQLETSNDELASSNEELLSMNEELQSSNEELEASQEELQSLNEELETINAQLADKVEELDRAQTDLVNLLESTAIATLFLGSDLTIKRFTLGLGEVIALLPGDEGRFLGDFALKFEHPELLDDVRAVVTDSVGRQVEVARHEDGRVFLLRITPYRISDHTTDGAVLSFIDISHLKDVERQATRRRHPRRERGQDLRASGAARTLAGDRAAQRRAASGLSRPRSWKVPAIRARSLPKRMTLSSRRSRNAQVSASPSERSSSQNRKVLVQTAASSARLV